MSKEFLLFEQRILNYLRLFNNLKKISNCSFNKLCVNNKTTMLKMCLNCLFRKSEVVKECKCTERILKGAHRDDKVLYQLNE